MFADGLNVLTSFIPLKSEAENMRKALIATGASRRSPCQISVNPPDATARSSRFSSPSQSTAEVGSRSILLHVSPRAIICPIFSRSRVGCFFANIVDKRSQKRRMWTADVQDQACLSLSSALLVPAPERPVLDAFYRAKGRLVASAFRVLGCLRTSGLVLLRLSNSGVSR